MSDNKHEHEHLDSEALSVKLENNAKARSWIIRGVVIFLVLVFFGGIALGANDLLTRESSMPPEAELDASITDPPEGSAEIYAYLMEAYNGALAAKPKLTFDTGFSYGNGDEFLKAAAFTAVNASADVGTLDQMVRITAKGLADHLYESLPHGETQYGDDFAQQLWALNINPAQLEDAQCTFMYYRCTACNKGKDEWTEQCPECKAKGTDDKPIMVKDYRSNYTFTLTFADDSPMLEQNFHLRNAEDIAAMLKGQLEQAGTVTGLERSYTNVKIVAAVNRMTKKLQSLQFIRDINAKLGLDINPALSGVGQAELAMSLRETTGFRFTWPAVTLNAKTRTMGTRENSQLTARIDAPAGQETPYTWESSDEAICAVDQDGYLKTGKQTGKAVITASFELNGETHMDECIVDVKTPAEKVAVSHRKLKLDIGATKQLTAKVTPNNATYKEVAWYTENPAVATVDQNGLVTAAGPGETMVYALAQDGWFRSSCAVTVTGGES